MAEPAAYDRDQIALDASVMIMGIVRGDMPPGGIPQMRARVQIVIYEAMAAAAPQPAAQATSDGWVAVSDRLPEAYEHVEVYPDPRDREHCYYASHDGGTNGVKAGSWYFNDRDGYDRAIHVTHWRPYSKPAAPDAQEVR